MSYTLFLLVFCITSAFFLCKWCFIYVGSLSVVTPKDIFTQIQMYHIFNDQWLFSDHFLIVFICHLVFIFFKASTVKQYLCSKIPHNLFCVPKNVPLEQYLLSLSELYQNYYKKRHISTPLYKEKQNSNKLDKSTRPKKAKMKLQANVRQVQTNQA